jgi:hypothetical protein
MNNSYYRIDENQYVRSVSNGSIERFDTQSQSWQRVEPLNNVPAILLTANTTNVIEKKRKLEDKNSIENISKKRKLSFSILPTDTILQILSYRDWYRLYGGEADAEVLGRFPDDSIQLLYPNIDLSEMDDIGPNTPFILKRTRMVKLLLFGKQYLKSFKERLNLVNVNATLIVACRIGENGDSYHICDIILPIASRLRKFKLDLSLAQFDTQLIQVIQQLKNSSSITIQEGKISDQDINEIFKVCPCKKLKFYMVHCGHSVSFSTLVQNPNVEHFKAIESGNISRTNSNLLIESNKFKTLCIPLDNESFKLLLDNNNNIEKIYLNGQMKYSTELLEDHESLKRIDYHWNNSYYLLDLLDLVELSNIRSIKVFRSHDMSDTSCVEKQLDQWITKRELDVRIILS